MTAVAHTGQPQRLCVGPVLDHNLDVIQLLPEFFRQSINRLGHNPFESALAHP
jgi:hypothetical protein